jgi:DNA polymerase I
LLKDLFASERRKAKTLNFSIAYGKTAHGLSQDWGVSIREAEAMLKAWYDARPEVDLWQKQTKDHAKKFGETRTLMGRYRQICKKKNMGEILYVCFVSALLSAHRFFLP